MSLCCYQTEKIKIDENINEKIPNNWQLNYMCMYIFVFLTGWDFTVILPTVWKGLNSEINATGTYMGLLISLYSLSGVLCGFIMSKISDEVKKTKIFYILCVLFAIFGHILYIISFSKYLSVKLLLL